MMKTLLLTTLCGGLLATSVMANPIKKGGASRPVSIEQQLANRLTYPQALRTSTENSVVVVQFRLDERNRVRNPQVFSADQSLNDELIRQLMHMRLTPTEQVSYVEPVYTARLRFRVSEAKTPTHSDPMLATR